jgi:DNA-binding transcriptional ArsR family regulator
MKRLIVARRHTSRRIAPPPRAVVESAAGFFRAIGDGERLFLLTHLLAGERCVGDLAAALGEGMSTVSQRLRVLRTEEVVTRRRDGKHVLYRLADDHVRDLVATALAHAAEHRRDAAKGASR